MMLKKNLNARLVKLPANIELILYMIKKELKSTKLFNGLARVRLDDCYFQSNFGTLILAYLGFDERPDDLHEFYKNLIDRYSEKIKADNNVIMKCAFEVHVEIMMEKKNSMPDS